MLVDNKFYFISLPRCASTSFLLNCLKKEIPIKHGNFNTDMLVAQSYERLKGINNETLIDTLYHPHEKLDYLEYKLGSGYDIISIKRDRHERFISTWKHVLDELYRMKEFDVYNKFIKLDANDLFYFNYTDLDKDDITPFIYEMIKRYDLKYRTRYVKIMMEILFTPTSFWHNHDTRIKWFDIKELPKLEKWVSEKLNMEFKLEQTNSSQHFDCNIQLDYNFKQKYNKIYDYFDFIRPA
jgi:hypothetical protein